MSKKGILVSVIIIVFLSVGAVIGVIMSEKSQYDKKAANLNASISETNASLTKLKSEKDSANFLPSDIVKYFLNEAKSEAFDKTKLYLAKEQQAKDVKAWLSLAKPLNTINTEEVVYEITEEGAKVTATIAFDGSTTDKTTKIFILKKEDSAWKIFEINNVAEDQTLDTFEEDPTTEEGEAAAAEEGDAI